MYETCGCMAVASEELSNGILTLANATFQADPGTESTKSAKTNGLLNLSVSHVSTTFVWAEATAVSKRRTASAWVHVAFSLGP